MRLSDKQIKELQTLLLELTGKECSTEEVQTAGLAILRFVYAKELQKYQSVSKENKDEEKSQQRTGVQNQHSINGGNKVA